MKTHHNADAAETSSFHANANQILIATLGTEPQVITLVLDALRQQFPIMHVVVIHTSPAAAPIAAALSSLKEVAKHYAQQQQVSFRFAAIVDEKGSVPLDITNEIEARSVMRLIYREVLRAKKEGFAVHLSIAGGRKVMAAYGTAVAQMLFDDRDHLWHLLSEGRLLTERRLHAQGDDTLALVPIPVIAWSDIPPIATDLAKSDDPWLVLERQQERQRSESRRKRRAFLDEHLSPAERQLVELLAGPGGESLTNKMLGQRLHRAPKTISAQLSSIFIKFRTWRNWEADAPIRRNTLVATFAPLFSDDD